MTLSHVLVCSLVLGSAACSSFRIESRMGTGALVLPSVSQEAVEVRLGNEQPSCTAQILDQVIISYPGGRNLSEFVREIKKYAARVGASGIKDIAPVDSTNASANIVTSAGLVTVSTSVAESLAITLYSCPGYLTPIRQGMWNCAQRDLSSAPVCVIGRENCENLYLREYGEKGFCREFDSVYCIIDKENNMQKQSCFPAESWCREVLAKVPPQHRSVNDTVYQCKQWNSFRK